MTEPNTAIACTGAAVVTLVTIAIGPLLGEYVIIFTLGLLGTLIALSETEHLSLKDSLIFIFKGVVFSVVFTGLVTSFLTQYLPKGTGLSAYAIIGAVSFMIGWSSNKLQPVRDWFIELITKARNGSSK